MADIHITLQGKGGVGKSVICSLLTQNLREAGKTVLPIDSDPVNASFTGYKALGAQYIDLIDGKDINPRKFDGLMEMIFNSDSECIVIDNGASSFISMASYMKSNQVVELLTSMGHNVYIHTVVTGGQSQRDTLIGFKELAESFGPSEAKLIVWINNFWGPIEKDGKSFEQMKVYKDNVKIVHGIVDIPQLDEKTFGEDMGKMLTNHLTFAEATDRENTKFETMAKQRLKMTWKNLSQNISVAV